MKQFTYLLFACLLLCTVSGCEEFPLQRDADYEGKPIDNNLYMTTWDFINQRQDIFALMREAILYSEIDTMLYHSTNEKNTFLLLNTKAMTAALTTLGVSSINQAPKTVWKTLLLYHIVYGEYHAYGKLPFEPINVITMRRDDLGIMTMKLQGKSSGNSTEAKYYARVQVNDRAGSSEVCSAVTSNLMTTNGVVHVFDNYCVYKK